MKKKKEYIQGSISLLKNCQYCGSNNRFFNYKGFWFRKVKIRCDDCGYETLYYKKHIDSINEWDKYFEVK